MSRTNFLQKEWPTGLCLGTTALFLVFGRAWLAHLSDPTWVGFLFIWLFAVILLSAFAVVRHADCLALKLGEPYGTLILTLAVIGMEVMMVASVMLTGAGKPTVARDTMFAVLMIVLNALLGLALILGGFRHREQFHNFQGSVSYLSMLVPLGLLALVLPYYLGPTTSAVWHSLRGIILAITTLGLYGVFLAVQTRRHPDFFVEPGNRTISDPLEINEHAHLAVRSMTYHITLLVASLLPVVFLSKKLAGVLDRGATQLGAPQALSGMLVAILILAPEGMAGVRAALANQLQRSVNLLFGAALSTITLTVPAVLLISIVTGQSLTLGLSPPNQILLATTLLLTVLTCATGRTNVLNGFIHLLLFVVYLVLIFEGEAAFPLR